MNFIFNAIRFISYSVGGLVIKKVWNWVNADVDPIPYTKEFDEEYIKLKTKYLRLTKKKEEYEAYRKNRRSNS